MDLFQCGCPVLCPLSDPLWRQPNCKEHDLENGFANYLDHWIFDPVHDAKSKSFRIRQIEILTSAANCSALLITENKYS